MKYTNIKYTKILFIILVTLFLLGCGSSGKKEVQINFKEGMASLNIKTFENAPPREIYANSNFKVIVELDNQMAYDVINGEIRLLGIDNKYFQILPLEKDFDILLGKSLTSPTGEKEFVEFNGRAHQLFLSADKYNANYFIQVNYDSTMEFSDSVCVNPKIYEVYDSGCKVQDKKSYSGQGAPLAITDMEEIISPGTGASVEFRFKLRNRGKGKVGIVNIGRASLGRYSMNCIFQQGPQGTGRSIDFNKNKQEATLICRAPLQDLSSYTTTVTLDFIYSYEEKLQHRLNLIK
jgi:hypothetical protein